MARYIGYFGDGNLGLTGELDEIGKLTGALGIFFQKAETGERQLRRRSLHGCAGHRSAGQAEGVVQRSAPGR